MTDKKKIVTLKLTEALDQRLDEIAAENVDLVGLSTFSGDPNRSEVARALIATYDQDRLRAYLTAERERVERERVERQIAARRARRESRQQSAA